MITMEQFEQIEDIRKNAQADDTPYIGIVDGSINVNGDPNKTEVKPADYTVNFIYPDNPDFRRRVDMAGDKVITTKNGWMQVERVYKGIYLTPRRMSDAVTTGAVIWQFLTTMTEDGELRPLTYEEQLEVMRVNYRELREASLDLVATVLGMNDFEKEFLAPVDTVRVAFEIAMNAPNLVNESDFFTAPLFSGNDRRS